MSKRGRTDTAIERLCKSIQSGTIEETRILIQKIEERINFSHLPNDENPLITAVNSGNLDALTFLVDSIFGDNTETIEFAYNLAVDSGKRKIADYLTFILDQREVNEGEADEDDSDEAEPEVGAAAAIAEPEVRPAAAMAESTVRPSIKLSRTLKNLEKLVGDTTISSPCKGEEEAEEHSVHSPDFGIPSAANQYHASAAPTPLPESASSAPAPAPAPAPHSLDPHETLATGDAADSSVIFV